MLLIILFLTTILPGSIYGFEVGSGDEVSVDLCKLPDGVFPDPGSCEDFIRCQSGVPDVEPCPDSLLFNPLKLTCDFSKTGNCSDPEDFDETSTPVQTSDVVCSEEGPNVYAIQSSCTEYYMCDNDTAFKVKCPKDLLMNADKLTCDYPENVDCDSVSSPEESIVGMKAVYEDDKDLESETETSVTFSSIDTSSPSAKTAFQVKSETDLDSKEITGSTSNDPGETTSAMLDATGNAISDKSVSPNPETTSAIGYLDENKTSKNPTLKETAQPNKEDSSSEVKPTRTNSDPDIMGKTSVFTSTSNVNDEVISSTSDAHRERSNLDDSTTENNARDMLTTPDTTVADLSSNTSHDFTSSESSEQSLSSGDKSVTAIQPPADQGINDAGSGSDIDIIDIFTTYSNNASQQLDVSTSDISTSNSLISTVTNERNLNTKAFSSDKAMTSDSLSETLESVSTLDSEVEAEFTTKIKDLGKKEGTGTETTKSEVSLSASYELTSQADVTDNKASVDNLTSVGKSTGTIVTDSNFNESTTRSSVLTSLGSLEDIKSESYFQDTTKIQTVVETDNKIAPEKTLTTNPALMSSDPLTDNETTKITTSTFSETVKVTPKYMTATTEEHQSFDAETGESASLSDDENEGYEYFTESVGESNLTVTPESIFFTEVSTGGLEQMVSSQPTETSIISDVNTEILDINDITSKHTISNKQSSLSNEFSTTSFLPQNSDSTSNSHFINQVINTEAITSSENISSGHISENVVDETHDYISSETTSPVSTEIDKSTESVINEETVISHSTSENQYPTLTSTHLKLTTGNDLIIASHLPNTKVTEITSVETSDRLYSTSNSTEHPTTTNAFSGSTNSGGNDIDLKMSSLKTQQPDETTEKIDLSSESDVTKVDQTYIDMYTNNSTSSLENSSHESFAASTSDLESLTYNSSSADTSENLKLGSSEVDISSVSERFQSTHTESSSDLTSILLNTRTEVTDINVTNEQTSEDDFDSSKSISKNTRINSKETELPYKIHRSTLSEVSTTLSGSDVVTSTKESLSSELITSLHHQSELSTKISETVIDFGGITVSTSAVTDPENILTTENKGTSTDVSRDTLNEATTTVFIHTSSNTIAGNTSETILSSTGQIDDSSPTSLPKNTDIFEITSDSLGPGTVTRPGATLKSSEITENLKLVSTDPYTLQINSTKSTTEINKTPNVSKETSEAFVNNSTVSTTVIGIGTTSTIENVTNKYEESSTSHAMHPFKSTSVVTVSSLIEVSNETSESFSPETKDITTENNPTSILDASTTILGLISGTAVPSTISEVTSIVSTTDMDGKTTSSDISSSVSNSKVSFASTSATATKQKYISTLSTMQIATSEDSTSDSSDSTHLILPITYFNDSDNSISTIDEASESPEYDSNNVTETPTSVITSTKSSYSSDENTSLENVKSTKQTPVIQVTTQFISTKLNSEVPDTYETSQSTGRRFEESSPNSQTNFDVVSRNTLSTEWPTKSSTGIQSITSDSIGSDESTSDIIGSDVITESTFKTSDTTSTKTTTYEKTSEPETVSKITFPSPDNLVSSTDILFESTSLSSLKVTSETTSKTKVETSRDITDGNNLSTSTNASIYSSEIELSTVDPTKISESTHLFTDSKRKTVPTTAETDEGLSTKDETELTDSIIKILSTSKSTSKFATEIPRESTIHTTSFSRIVATETGNPFPITATTHDTTKENNLINERTTETTPKTSNTDSISFSSKKLPEDKGETDSITVDPTISESTDLFTDSKRETVPTSVETDKGLSTKVETESTDSIIKILSTSTSKFATEIPRESTIHTTSFSRIIATETGNPFPITATTRDTTKETNLINDKTTETTLKTSDTDSISISSKTLPEDKEEIDSSTLDPAKISESTDLFTDSKRETVPATVETVGGLSTKNETESTDSIIKILSTSTSTSKFATEISRESSIHTTSFSRIIATETGNPFPITATTRDTTEENNLINDRTTETTPKTSNTDSISIASKTLPEDTGETDYIFSTTDSSVVKTTVMKTTSSKDISESDLQQMSTTEMTVLKNDTNERITESNTDFTSVSMASINLEEKTNSTEYSSTTYFPSDLRTETSHLSSNTDIESENKETSSIDTSSETTVTKTHSKDISESDLSSVPTTETTVLIFNDANKTTTESITDVSNVSITSRNTIGKTESTEDPSTTNIPAAFRTETSLSSANTDTESEFQRISSTNIPSESSTTVNPICVISEGSFPYPDDCNKFYRCTKGVPVQSSCVGNEHFDPVKRICTNPCLAKCDPNADCGTTESKTSAEESTSSQTMSSKITSSTSELYNTGTEETSVATTPDDSIEDTTPNKISKSTSEEASTITNSAFRSSILESTTEKLETEFFTSDESSPSVADINATKDLTEISSDDYMSSRTFENVTTSDDSNPISSDVTITSTTVTYEITPETQTEVIEVSSSTIKTSTETSSFGSSEFTVTTDITTESSGDGEDSSSTSTLTTSTKCENKDCLSSKPPTSATLVPFRLCPRNDFLSSPNCSEYLDCTGKVPKKLECPNGLHFNPSTRACDWPYSAECGTPPKPLYKPTDLINCPCKSCIIPSTKSCSHYYLCIGFTAYEMKCSNSLYFDRSRNTCNYTPLVDCSHLTSTSTTTEIEPTETSTKTSTVEISTSTKATTPASFVCPSQEGLFRYPGNCGMFYQCANWYPYIMNCAATTHFSEITQRCEYPCDAKCDLTLNCGVTSTAPPSDPRCSCNNCRLPSPESCTKYIVCVNGRARIEYCPWGKTFDARRSTCDWAHKVACHPSAMCPERNGLFSHKEDCHKFVHCSNGIPYVKKCPSILEFDPIKKRCEWPNGRCNYLPIITRDVDYKNEEHRKGWKCPKTFGYYSADQHCNKFYHCSFGTPTLKECSQGLLYNPRYQTCDWKKQVRCNSNRHLKPRKCRVFDHHVVCSEDRRPKLHVLCNMYYDCTAGRACAKQCPVGLYFNNMTGVCDLPENVKCLNPGEEDYSLRELSLKCASGDQGRQVNPTNDSCFYHCRQGKIVSGCCSKGHVYNLHKDKCERRTRSLRI